MFGKKIKICLDNNELRLLADILIEYKNELHRQGKYTDAIDELLIKVIA